MAYPAPALADRKGSRNKFSGDLKAMVMEALANAFDKGNAVDCVGRHAPHGQGDRYAERTSGDHPERGQVG